MIIGYSDAGFDTNHDSISQLGRIVLLADATGSTISVILKSYKSRRVAHPVLAAKIITFRDMLGDAFALQHKLQQTMHLRTPIHLITDSKCLFDFILKGSRTA